MKSDNLDFYLKCIALGLLFGALATIQSKLTRIEARLGEIAEYAETISRVHR